MAMHETHDPQTTLEMATMSNMKQTLDYDKIRPTFVDNT